MATATSLLAVAVTALIFAWRRRVASPVVPRVRSAADARAGPFAAGVGLPAVAVDAGDLCIVDRWRDTSIPWRVVSVLGIFGMSFTLFDLLGRYLYSRAMQINVVTIAVILVVACLMNLRRKALA
jgi:hypothetical protein